MASERQIQANRLNAQQSCGPRTPEGKLASSANSRKHGIHMSDAALHNDPESASDIEKALTDYLDYYQPQSPAELDVLHELALCRIHTRRLQRLGAGLLNRSREQVLAQDVYPGPDGTTIHRFELADYPEEERRTVSNMLLAAAWARIEPTMEAVSRQEARIATRRRRALADLRELIKDRNTLLEVIQQTAPAVAREPEPPPEPDPVPDTAPAPASPPVPEPAQPAILQNEPNFSQVPVSATEVIVPNPAPTHPRASVPAPSPSPSASSEEAA